MTIDKPWYENDRFWEATQPFLFSENIMQKTSSEIDNILKFLEINSGSKVLDLCCGPGRHSHELARRGYLVTGVDRNAQYIDEAVKTAAEEKLEIEFIKSDMRYFKRAEAFDAIINYFTSFGYFDNPDEEWQVVDNIYNSLKPGGRLLMEMVGKEVVARTHQARSWGEKEGIFLLHEQKPVDNWTYMDNRRIVIKDGKKEEFNFTLRLYSAHELTVLLKTSGFTLIDIYGDIEGAPYDNMAKRLIAVAKK
jgi:SAM-dependent methyltransferase